MVAPSEFYFTLVISIEYLEKIELYLTPTANEYASNTALDEEVTARQTELVRQIVLISATVAEFGPGHNSSLVPAGHSTTRETDSTSRGVVRHALRRRTHCISDV